MRILFVCTGNTCRSPMAEAFLRELSAERGLRLEVRSAGVSTVDGLPVSRHALQVLENNGIAHKAHRHLRAEACSNGPISCLR
ncbi:low molecular weight phosphatase family protein [Paenibacillus sp. P22]|uniref:arsenate reductase/protein-tyrosine-phosphatase family protein n=1 Tax=Paenibacillus sp. P22 TaxID=483908 RepID=UPI0003900B10|nr:hypothetical protein BN871_EV_00140 [Paenibacillus sp. P22]